MTGDNSITTSELKKIAEDRSGGRIAVIAVDATWGNALRMKTSYPPDAVYGEGGEKDLLST
jgi:hypothetical protein